ncbi:hypothetical protein [Rubritalea tangerina]|uniref:hypothetical protein n=1 Tax=Rubritalea tangerina TaxID=430798 RepID=UPI00361A5941
MPKKKPSINLDSLKSATKNVSRPVDTLKSEKESEAKSPSKSTAPRNKKAAQGSLSPHLPLHDLPPNRSPR